MPAARQLAAELPLPVAVTVSVRFSPRSHWQLRVLALLGCSAAAVSGSPGVRAASGSAGDPAPYATSFIDGAAVLAAWTPQEECAHCGKGRGRGRGMNVQDSGNVSILGGKDKDECTNMTRAATSFGPGGMTHTTLALASSTATLCTTEQQVCSSGHLTWNPSLRYGNFSVVARWFPAAAHNGVNTATGFIGLDSPSNEASITMGFHGADWLGGNGEGAHRYQHGIYAHVKGDHNREYTNTTADISTGFHTYGLLWTPTVVEWRFDGASVRRVTDTSIIPQIDMQLRLHTRSGYCDHMTAGSSFQATFRSFSYTPYRGPAPGPSPGPGPPGPPPPPSPGPAAKCKAAGGILAATGKHAGEVCCARSCGVCGGKECGDNPGGNAACCANAILKSGRQCGAGAGQDRAPCAI